MQAPALCAQRKGGNGGGVVQEDHCPIVGIQGLVEDIPFVVVQAACTQPLGVDAGVHGDQALQELFV